MKEYIAKEAAINAIQNVPEGFGLEWPYDEGYDLNPCPLKCTDGWYSRKPKPEWFCWEGARRNKK